MRASFPSLAALLCAATLLSACAVPGHDEIQAQFDAGLVAYDAGNYQVAYKTWGKIADYDLAALRNIALMLRKGQGVKKDPETALRKMLQAADLGLVTAQYDAAEMIANGEAGPADVAAAIPWYARAADGGHPVAALQLAKLYDEGKAVPQNLKEARRLYKIAADAGMEDAAKRLAELGGPPTQPAAAQGPLPPVGGHIGH